MPRTEHQQTPSIVGERIRTARQRAGLFQRELAERVGVRTWHICKVERGLAEPSPVLIGKIAQACKVDVDALTGSPS